jgi:hypothetical protein
MFCIIVSFTAVLQGLTGGPSEAGARSRSGESRAEWRLRELRNFRDAGAAMGLPAGRIFRSDDPRHRPFRACERLQAASIRTIVKLNANQGEHRMGRRPAWRRGACGLPELAVSIPYERTEGALGVSIYSLGRPRSPSMARRKVVRDLERQLGMMFRELARMDERRLPLLFHCSVGRDRTGIVLALLGLAAGASPAAVEADYLASGQTSAVTLRRLLGRVGRPERFFLRDLGLSNWEIRQLRRLLRGAGPLPGAASARARRPPAFGPP